MRTNSKLIVLAHNIRSTHNVGSLFRTCDGLGVNTLYLTGFTPYPQLPQDTRLPHVANRATLAIRKTALGAEKLVTYRHYKNIVEPIRELRKTGYSIVALEQTKSSIDIRKFKPPQKLALIIGNELSGVDASTLSLADSTVEIKMRGNKESFNVSVAAGIAIFCLLNPKYT